MDRGWLHREGFLLCLILHLLLLQGRGGIFTVSHPGFEQHGVDPVVKKPSFWSSATASPLVSTFALSAILEVEAQLQPTMLFLWLMSRHSPFLRWDLQRVGGGGGGG